MILTVTLNPSLDVTITLDDFKTNHKNDFSNRKISVGGKGINVSNALYNLGIDSECISLNFLEHGFVSKKLYKKGYKRKLIDVIGDLRTNYKIFDKSKNQMTEINEISSIGDDFQVQKIIKKVENEIRNLSKGDILVLAGSVPSDFDNKIYYDLINLAKERDVFVVLDAGGELLREGIKANPNMIKPNLDELQEFANKELNSVEEIISVVDSIKNDKIEYVCVTMGSDGAYMKTNNGAYIANAIDVVPKKLYSAGDAFVAGLLKELDSKNDIQMLKTAVACATATIMCEYDKMFSQQDVEKLIEKVQIINIG